MFKREILYLILAFLNFKNKGSVQREEPLQKKM